MKGPPANGEQPKNPSPKKVGDLSTQSFSEIVGRATFVDKTLFIKAFLEAPDSVIVALAPRRFGKSTNMDMLKEFLTGNKELFQSKNLKICTDTGNFFANYCKVNPVIYVDFKSVSGITTDEFLRNFKRLIHWAFNQHKYLIKKIDGKYYWSHAKLEDLDSIEVYEKYWKNPENLNRVDVIDGLKDLSRCLHVYHEKPVYILIDEYDAPIMKFILMHPTSKNDRVLHETIYVIGEIMSATFKNNEHLNRGLINACVRIDEVCSHANNIKYYRFLERPRFSPYFGFSSIEVEKLLKKEEFAALRKGINENEFAGFKEGVNENGFSLKTVMRSIKGFLGFKEGVNEEDFGDLKKGVKDWYNGYRTVHSANYTIYSPYSILEFLSRSQEKSEACFGNYWVDTGSIFHLRHLFGHSIIHNYIRDLIKGEHIEIGAIEKFTIDDIITLKDLVHENSTFIESSQADLFLQFLAENGYLNVVKRNSVRNTITIRIPNEEIRNLLQEKCYNSELLKKKYHSAKER